MCFQGSALHLNTPSICLASTKQLQLYLQDEWLKTLWELPCVTTSPSLPYLGQVNSERLLVSKERVSLSVWVRPQTLGFLLSVWCPRPPDTTRTAPRWSQWPNQTACLYSPYPAALPPQACRVWLNELEMTKRVQKTITKTCNVQVLRWLRR